MKVLLVRPISDTYIISPPIGLGYLATALRKANHDPRILDCTKAKFGFRDFEEFIRKDGPDVVGFQVWSCDAENVKKCLRIVRSIDPKIVTIIGGAHPSGVCEESLDFFKDADYGFKGEGEIGLPKLINKLSGDKKISLEEVPGLIWRDGVIVKSNPPIFIDDLDVLGFPAWDLIDPGTYPKAPHQGFAMAFPAAPIFTTRGCPYPCTFCATRTITGRRLRHRSIDNVIEEIKILRYKYGVKEIHIEDDNFTMNKNFVKEFCQKLISEKLDIFWYCSSGVRLDSLDDDILLLMKRSNCYTLTIAIESGNQRVLNLMKKDLTLDEIRKRVSVMNKAGYRPTGLFIIGFPGETKDEMRQTLEFAMSLNLKRAQFAIFHPLPGSEIYEELKSKGKLSGLDWSNLKPSEAAYADGETSAGDLKRFQRMAFLKFHLRPRILYYQLKEIRSLSNLFYLIRRVADMLFS